MILIIFNNNYLIVKLIIIPSLRTNSAWSGFSTDFLSTCNTLASEKLFSKQWIGILNWIYFILPALLSSSVSLIINASVCLASEKLTLSISSLISIIWSLSMSYKKY